MSICTADFERIIEVANSLQTTDKTGASKGEHIAAAFVLNRQDLLPNGCQDIVEAWDRLDTCWQNYVRFIKRNYMYKITKTN